MSVFRLEMTYAGDDCYIFESFGPYVGKLKGLAWLTVAEREVAMSEFKTFMPFQKSLQLPSEPWSSVAKLVVHYLDLGFCLERKNYMQVFQMFALCVCQ